MIKLPDSWFKVWFPPINLYSRPKDAAMAKSKGKGGGGKKC